jgi:hypothetical protein
LSGRLGITTEIPRLGLDGVGWGGVAIGGFDFFLGTWTVMLEFSS